MITNSQPPLTSRLARPLRFSGPCISFCPSRTWAADGQVHTRRFVTGARMLGTAASPKIGSQFETVNLLSPWTRQHHLTQDHVSQAVSHRCGLEDGRSLTGPCATLATMAPVVIASTMKNPVTTAARVLNRESSARTADIAESSGEGWYFSSEIASRESLDRRFFSRSMADACWFALVFAETINR